MAKLLAEGRKDKFLNERKVAETQDALANLTAEVVTLNEGHAPGGIFMEGNPKEQEGF